jgi:RNA polymerase-binding transcription factor DksA
LDSEAGTAKRRFCELCKAEISTERIEAIPETRRCVQCAHSQESKGNPEFDLLISQTQLGKTNSLKKNYGDVTVQKRRRNRA